MTEKQKALLDAQEFVKTVLAKNFNQKVKATELRAAAEKILDAVPKQTKQAA